MKKIEAANKQALERMLSATPVLIDVIPAHEAIPKLRDKMILHAGPPIGWERMCGPMRGAIAGIAVFEGWATDLAEAERVAGDGAFDFHPNHHFDAVGPMTGMTTLNQPVLVVENQTYGNKAYCAINEGLGKVMRFGGNDAEVLDRLRWLPASLSGLQFRVTAFVASIAMAIATIKTCSDALNSAGSGFAFTPVGGLMKEGVYAYVRNPAYLGLVFVQMPMFGVQAKSDRVELEPKWLQMFPMASWSQCGHSIPKRSHRIYF